MNRLINVQQLVGLNRSKSLLFILAFAVIGSALLLATRAAAPFASLEPEQGAIAGAACTISDSSASAGTAVRFGGCPSVGTASQISQYGVIWTFDKAYPTGQFASGDYWVVGPVVVTSISPGWNGSQNGSMVNPVVSDKQGYVNPACISPFDGTYDPALNVADNLPLTLASGSSLASSIWKPGGETDIDRPCLKSVSVLTILGAPAPSGSFRPPFAGGADKTVRFNNSTAIPRAEARGMEYLPAPAGQTSYKLV